jgi:hypothetical protein
LGDIKNDVFRIETELPFRHPEVRACAPRRMSGPDAATAAPSCFEALPSAKRLSMMEKHLDLKS